MIKKPFFSLVPVNGHCEVFTGGGNLVVLLYDNTAEYHDTSWYAQSFEYNDNLASF